MKFWQVDSFTDVAFKGNPAGVLIQEQALPESFMQNIAMELNLSETAFVTLNKEGASIRWFTPNAEVNLCGHATLAAAHILWSENFIKENEIIFQSKSGPLPVYKTDSGYTLDFPVQRSVPKPEYNNLVVEILGRSANFVGSNGEDCVAVIDDEEFLKNYQPNLASIAKLKERGFLLTCKSSDKKYDYVYRGFFPKLDIAEDPVTGSANTLLAPYWSEKLGKTKLSAYQASKRGGELSLEVKQGRVHISGKAITTIRGDIFC